ncbi:FAD-binding protein, partial [Xanthovirga aplysinae]|uniref:FAD-binding protein n=1 Tax=Xanthovirga aplysinae TaxID=2529853 RepID=UPI0012BD50A2
MQIKPLIKNWGGTLSFRPRNYLNVQTVQEIQKAVKEAYEEGKKIRLIGGGHSWTPLIRSEDILISLDNFQGIEAVDKENNTCWVKAGTRLRKLGMLLHEQGMAMENLGDIDVQSIAGAVSTGTHGTGVNFGTLATQIIGIQLVNGKGELIECSNEQSPELFRAAQTSLGVLGIITKVKLQLKK